jgi:hypothetical protein
MKTIKRIMNTPNSELTKGLNPGNREESSKPSSAQ